MPHSRFETFFAGPAMHHLLRAVDAALDEDGRDLTSQAVFGPQDRAEAEIRAKEDTLAVGLPMAALVLARVSTQAPCRAEALVPEGAEVQAGTVVLRLEGPATALLKAERVILDFICHLSGIANLTRRYAQALQGSRTRLLDTRKTLPGLRYPEKYAVLAGGGHNHRLNLEEMLMLKDNHVDRAGSISQAVAALRATYSPCPPIEVECRNLDEAREAASLGVSRIMLDNMSPDMASQALALIPAGIETEISGGVDLDTIAGLGRLGADFISVGRITHSAPAADFSMRMLVKK